MKKIFLGIAIVIIVIGAICLGLRSTVNSKIQSKIEELNKNGFLVSHEHSFDHYQTIGKGKIEIIYPDKVASYLFSKIEDEDTKKSLEKQYNLLDRATKDRVFEGITFDYNFVMNNISSKLDLDLYLTNLSQRTMYKLEQTYSYAPQTNWLKPLLENKKIHLNIDENKNFKLDDINITIPNDSFITIRGVNGTQNNIKVALFKIADVYDDSYTKGSLLIDNLAFDYSSQKEKKSSKLDIENLEFIDYTNVVSIKNLILDSQSLQDKDNISGNSKISFDELNIVKDNKLYLTSSSKNIGLNKTSLDIAFDKIPYKKYEEMLSSISDKDFLQKYDDFMKAVSQNGFQMTINGASNNFKIDENKYFNTLKFNSTFKMNQKFDSMNNIKSIKDIFEVAKATLDIDADSVKSLSSLLKDEEFKAMDIENNQKRFEIELKDDGLYFNSKKFLDQKDLEFSSLNTLGTSVLAENGKVVSSYELVDKNLLRVTFKYTTNLENVTAGGLAVSFPQLKDASKIKAHNTKSFDKIDYYKGGQEIYSGMLGKNVKAEYLMVEGWDKNWTDTKQEKEFSLDIDISELKKDYSYLEINLRGGSLNENVATTSPKYSEIVPNESQSFTTDQQSYPVNIADIYLLDLKLDKK
ncbi:hypothetical protein L5F68_05105 [Aliarcobacter butzleri]|uniref:hypothetical protein n=1 Tax=Aliarcobacter butzleri TaxID=28197 RepID=UPI001EDBE6FB|nr:hypothetical protein [Aliarcobacter butzleri]MCG3687788.1 hypothetical protein [Aliarcobacter butzleri]MCG3703709.1 hypothetical protein [Aliarcobacter butzleri]